MKAYTPHEFKVQRVRECVPMTETLDQPDKVAAYWRANIPPAEWYDPAKEALVLLVLNTRRRILGHNLSRWEHWTPAPCMPGRCSARPLWLPAAPLS